MGMPVTRHRFTVDDYHRMAEAGILAADDRVELLDGEIVRMTPIGARHARCVDDLTRTLVRTAGDAAIVRVQGPVVTGPYSEPQPDLVLLRPRPDRYGSALPGRGDVLLVVEVPDTSVARDREAKLPLYAGAGIPEVWLVDLPACRVEVYRGPRGDGYAEREIVGRDGTLTVAAIPDIALEAREIIG